MSSAAGYLGYEKRLKSRSCGYISIYLISISAWLLLERERKLLGVFQRHENNNKGLSKGKRVKIVAVNNV